MHPAATTLAPVSAAASSVSIESCFAFSTKPQVLTTTTSAPEASVLTSQPPASRRAASSSESTSLRAQPRVSRATRRGVGVTDTPTRLPVICGAVPSVPPDDADNRETRGAGRGRGAGAGSRLAGHDRRYAHLLHVVLPTSGRL